MRIGLFTDSYLPRVDGIAISTESFRAGLEANGHTVFVFCPKRPEPFHEPNDRVYRFPSLPSLSYEGYRDTFPFTPKHIRFINSLKLDIIHTFTQTQIGMVGAYIAKHNHLPLVTTCGADFDLIKDYRRTSIAPIVLSFGTVLATQTFMSLTALRLFLQPAFPPMVWLDRMIRVAAAFYNDQCDLTIVPSLKSYQSIASYMKKPPVILPTGIDMRLVPHKPIPRKRHNLPESEILFVSASRLVREKRINFLIRAFADLPPEIQVKIAFVIIGDGPDMPSLKELVSHLHLARKIIFTGRVKHEQVLEIVSACDVYIHASLRETQGLVINEAAACGKPIIMIDRKVNSVLKEGENGLFAANSIYDFGKQMSTLATDKALRIHFGHTSKKLAQNTSQEAAAAKLVSLYQKLIEKKRSG